MDAFSYLSVLLSIVLGLGITQLLQGFGRLMSARSRVRPYWPSLTWAVALLFAHVQNWWSMFALRGRTQWSFADFALVLSNPVLLYLLAALALPERLDGEGGEVDLEQHYYSHARWFFALLMLLLVFSVLKAWDIDGELKLDADRLVHAIWFVASAIAMATRRRWFHAANAVFGAALLAAYIGALFAQLR